MLLRQSVSSVAQQLLCMRGPTVMRQLLSRLMPPQSFCDWKKINARFLAKKKTAPILREQDAAY